MPQLTSVNSKRKIKIMEYKPISIDGCLDETLVTSSTSIPYEQRHMFVDKITRQQQQRQQKQMFMYEHIAEPSINYRFNSTCSSNKNSFCDSFLLQRHGLRGLKTQMYKWLQVIH